MSNVQKFDHPSCKVLVTGVSGTGKTTLYSRLVHEATVNWRFVYDHQGEFAQRFKKKSCRNGDELIEKTQKGGWVIYDPLEEFGKSGHTKEGFNFFCAYAFEVCQTQKGRKIFCVDELQKLTDIREVPVEFLAICETGRRFQMDVFCISQAPNRLHNAIRNQLTEVYTFRQSDKNAIEYLADNGFDADKVRELPKFHYLYRNLDTGESRDGVTQV